MFIISNQYILFYMGYTAQDLIENDLYNVIGRTAVYKQMLIQEVTVYIIFYTRLKSNKGQKDSLWNIHKSLSEKQPYT